MNTTINQTSYPYFVPDQVLTAEDLNTLVNYLEGLNQLTRTHFIGMGIVQGLEVQTLENQTKVKITRGCGITSRGFVIKIPTQTGADPEITFTHYRDDQTLPITLFIPGEPSQESYAVTELIEITEGQAKNSFLKPLDKASVENKVVVALYYWQDVPRSENCFLTYDTAGLDRNSRLRYFLLPKTDPKKKSTSQADSPPSAEASVPEPTVLSAEHLLRASYPADQMSDPWRSDAQANITTIFEARNTFFKEFYPQMQRFGYVDAKSTDLTKISNYNAWRDNYIKICENAIDSISTAFLKLYKLFSPVFISFHPNSQQDFQGIKNNLEPVLKRFDPTNRESVAAKETEPPYALQYFYDYLSQLVAAFFELAEAAFDLMDDCTPELDRFPQFLMLGVVPPSDGTPTGYDLPSAYRTQFIQPRIYNNNQTRIQQVRYLYKRLLKLCEIQEKAPADKDKPENQSIFCLLPFYRAPVKITPSKDSAAPLSERAIPYYLNYPKLYRYWNYDAYRKGRSDRHLAYFFPKQDSGTSHTFDELTYRLDAYNFYRIEGHIGRSNTEAFKAIQEYQQRYNLPFDIITLKLGNLDSLKDLNVSAQVADLNANFGRLKDRFQTLWKVNQEWSKNALLNTLKRIFFDQPGLEKVNPDLMLSPFLDRAQVSESYEFVSQQDANHQPTGRYEVFLKNRSGIHIAQYIFHTSEADISGQQKDFHWLNFSGLTETEIQQEKSRITAGLVDVLTLDKIIYKLELSGSISANAASFYLRLSSKDVLTVPLDQSQPGAGKVPQQIVTIELRSSSPFSISLTSGQPQVDDAVCPDVLTLYGLLRDVPEDFVSMPGFNFNFKIGDKKAAEDLGASELRSLVEAYQQRLQRLVGLHFFHLFAKQHPGLEPLGGVPRGGTFILVYVDEKNLVQALLADDQNSVIAQARIDRVESIQTQALLPPSSTDQSTEQQSSDTSKLSQKEIDEFKAREDIVIADFCLPYRSSSDAPSVSYVLARPRPIVLLEKNVFCEGDDHEYRFILEPEGGTVKGEGIIFKEYQHFFQPSKVSRAIQDELSKGNEVAITFSYTVDDTYDTLTVTIYPLPRPTLTIQEGQNFCQNSPAIEIGLDPTTSESIELQKVTIQNVKTGTTVETRTLEPGHYATQGQPETLTITAYVHNREGDCSNTITHTVTINPLPDASFRVEGEAGRTTFLTTDSPVNLNPTRTGGQFHASDGLNDVTTAVIQNNQFVPAGVQLDATATEKLITIQYTITEAGCTNTSTPQQLRVLAPPTVRSLNLVPIGGTDRIQLRTAPPFLQSNFTGTYQFEAETIGHVESINFTYTAPSGVVTTSLVSGAPYVIPGPWLPLVGNHRIQAQAFTDADGQGLAGSLLDIPFIVNNDPPGPDLVDPSSGPHSPSSDSPPAANASDPQTESSPTNSEATSENPTSVSANPESASSSINSEAISEHRSLESSSPTIAASPVSAEAASEPHPLESVSHHIPVFTPQGQGLSPSFAFLPPHNDRPVPETTVESGTLSSPTVHQPLSSPNQTLQSQPEAAPEPIIQPLMAMASQSAAGASGLTADSRSEPAISPIPLVSSSESPVAVLARPESRSALPIKRSQALTVGTIAVLLVLGWAYASSRQLTPPKPATPTPAKTEVKKTTPIKKPPKSSQSL
jgi:hypothetical protein